MKKMQKGFSLVELMVVIAIIAILAAVAIPMYSNYTTRARLGTQLTNLGGVKAEAAEYIANNNNATNYTSTDFSNVPSGATFPGNGVIRLNTSSIVSGSNIQIAPTVGSGSITWECQYSTQITSSQAPNGCVSQ
ncbi:hypothetical protein KX01_47 [Francisella frigiditurris]|uniref:Type IV pili, pilus assembly protein n=2 Tax=Francisella frigiditurris TaxID=1542390 RepID=A0A1J0KUG4_9GAMM|nr:hypothetical protein KX01_47 [Francisella frigiditurris]